MIKRMTKATSLLVAAAAIISIVPAHAADYTKIDSQEGTIYNAVAYKDGKFYIDGEVNDKDEAAYYLADGKYNNLSDIDSGSDVTNYGSKYLDIQDGDYFVNLDNGEVTDEDLAENNVDDAASALRKKIKDKADDRYSDHAELKTDLAELEGNVKFGQTWYKTTYGGFNVYTDVDGNYIDADYNVGKIKVTTTEDGADAKKKTVTIENTDDDYDSYSHNGDVTADVSDAVVIGQDANYIYRTAKITINTTNSVVKEINGIAVADNNTFTQETGKVSFEVIQKISKAQASDDVDGAKYAKTVSTYAITDEDGNNISSKLLADSSKTIADGKIISYAINNDTKRVDVQTIELKTDNGFNYTDTTDVDDESETALDTDANGNLWRLDGGYIYKFDNDEDWTKVYKVDGSFDKMSVYDENNIVAWNEGDEVYSVISGKGTTTPTDPTTPVVNKGWVKTDAGWTFYNTDGTQVKGQWVNDGGVWYYIKADGVMATGWIKDGSTWYFLQSSGAMKTGWLNDNGTWYYLQSSGAMATGWLNDNGTWYFLNSSGAMLANTTVDGYKLGASGAWIK